MVECKKTAAARRHGVQATKSSQCMGARHKPNQTTTRWLEVWSRFCVEEKNPCQCRSSHSSFASVVPSSCRGRTLLGKTHRTFGAFSDGVSAAEARHVQGRTSTPLQCVPTSVDVGCPQCQLARATHRCIRFAFCKSYATSSCHTSCARQSHPWHSRPLCRMERIHPETYCVRTCQKYDPKFPCCSRMHSGRI